MKVKDTRTRPHLVFFQHNDIARLYHFELWSTRTSLTTYTHTHDMHPGCVDDTSMHVKVPAFLPVRPRPVTHPFVGCAPSEQNFHHVSVAVTAR